ncbi:flagellar FlbD family protein [Garciella nitratireducens]|uniref:Flagellar protein FlbD n=1 Tax=Garciella nitratireducens DSM 15102 TaxID=1121911 RepID=A0A1T4LDI7_9FIRM|nr:flagellar FlbD family protein [Garciella nitratireducens]SJZ52716.1 flagellar protein FlbD [Garciella nitratireducens DSM 15102]
MIELTTLKGKSFYLNAELIEQIEELPDTIITLVGGKKIRVQESAQIVVEKVITYKRKIYHSTREVKKNEKKF